VLHPRRGEELSDEAWERVIREASGLGISVFIIIGGEPLCRKSLLRITAQFPECLFLIFTNSTLLDEEKVWEMAKQKNVIPILSVEGYSNATDYRRGEGVFRKFSNAAAVLRKNKLFFGASITLSQDNFQCISNDDFIDELYRLGFRLFFFVEYLPAQPLTENKALNEEQKADLLATTARLRNKYKALFLDFPGDEYLFGGCLSAGRGFIHISAEGNVEPCPFSPYSDSNVGNGSLEEALNSPLFKAIRNHPDRMDETKGNCALWIERNWVKSLIEN
jgi:MoaA/NifB/PqqE/SkfB family radical SAM enzyme